MSSPSSSPSSSLQNGFGLNVVSPLEPSQQPLDVFDLTGEQLEAAATLAGWLNTSLDGESKTEVPEEDLEEDPEEDPEGIHRTILDTIQRSYDRLMQDLASPLSQPPSRPPSPPSRATPIQPAPPAPVIVPRSPRRTTRRPYSVVRLPNGGFSYRPILDRFSPRSLNTVHTMRRVRRVRALRETQRERELRDLRLSRAARATRLPRNLEFPVLRQSPSRSPQGSVLLPIQFDETMIAPEGRCTICLEGFCNTTVVYVPCQPPGQAFKDHMFHHTCLMQWVESERRQGRPRTCPMCRFEF